MTKNQQISALILRHVANGLTLQEAVNAVFGAGAWDRIAGDIYDALNAKAAETATKH